MRLRLKLKRRENLQRQKFAEACEAAAFSGVLNRVPLLSLKLDALTRMYLFSRHLSKSLLLLPFLLYS